MNTMNLDARPLPPAAHMNASLHFNALRLNTGMPTQTPVDLDAALDQPESVSPLMQGSARAQALCHAIRHWAGACLQPVALRLHCHADAPPAPLRRALAQHLAHANALLTDADFVLGEQPSAADYALFGPLATLKLSQAGRDHLRTWPALQRFVERMTKIDRRAALWSTDFRTLECAS